MPRLKLNETIFKTENHDYEFNFYTEKLIKESLDCKICSNLLRCVFNTL